MPEMLQTSISINFFMVKKRKITPFYAYFGLCNDPKMKVSDTLSAIYDSASEVMVHI